MALQCIDGGEGFGNTFSDTNNKCQTAPGSQIGVIAIGGWARKEQGPSDKYTLVHLILSQT